MHFLSTAEAGAFGPAAKAIAFIPAAKAVAFVPFVQAGALGPTTEVGDFGLATEAGALRLATGSFTLDWLPTATLIKLDVVDAPTLSQVQQWNHFSTSIINKSRIHLEVHVTKFSNL